MSNNPGSLSDEDVRQIALLVETLERSTFDYLQVEMGDLKVTLGKGMPSEAVASTGSATPAVAAHFAAPAPAVPAPQMVAAPVALTPAAAGRSDSPAHEGTIAVVSPTVGRFYARPDPSAPPFVSVGAQVGPDSTVALVEVMKMFTAVPAGVDGVIAEVCVQNEQFVEFGQILFRIRPAAR